MALTIADNYSRMCIAIKIGQSLKGMDVVNTLEDIHVNRGILPGRIKVDNGPKFISKELDYWAWENKVTLDFPVPGNRQTIRLKNHSMEVSGTSV